MSYSSAQCLDENRYISTLAGLKAVNCRRSFVVDRLCVIDIRHRMHMHAEKVDKDPEFHKITLKGPPMIGAMTCSQCTMK